MQNTNEAFIKSYNELYEQICNLYNKNTNHQGNYKEDFAMCINFLRNKNILINKNFNFLDGVRKVRNIKIHDNFVNENLLVNIEIIDKCDILTKKLKYPPIIKEYTNKRQRQIYQIDIAKTDKFIFEVIRDMLMNGYSYIPILLNNNIIGLLDSSVIVSHLAQNSVDHSSKISDIDKSMLAKNSTHIYEIISNQNLIEDCIKLFDQHYINNKKLTAIIVTSTGKNTDKILEIITSYDLNRIEENFL